MLETFDAFFEERPKESDRSLKTEAKETFLRKVKGEVVDILEKGEDKNGVFVKNGKGHRCPVEGKSGEMHGHPVDFLCPVTRLFIGQGLEMEDL